MFLYLMHEKNMTIVSLENLIIKTHVKVQYSWYSKTRQMKYLFNYQWSEMKSENALNILSCESNFSQCRVIIVVCYIHASGFEGEKKSLNFFRRITKNNFHSSVFLHLIEMYNEMGPESQIRSLVLQYYSIKKAPKVC